MKEYEKNNNDLYLKIQKNLFYFIELYFGF